MLAVKLHNNWSDERSYYFYGKTRQTIHMGVKQSGYIPVFITFAHELAHHKLNQYNRKVCHYHGEIEAWEYVIEHYIDNATKLYLPSIKSIIRGYQKQLQRIEEYDKKDCPICKKMESICDLISILNKRK